MIDLTLRFHFLVVIWLALMGLGALVANQKRRPIEEGLILTVIFGPLGILIETLVPSLKLKKREAERQPLGRIEDDALLESVRVLKADATRPSR